MTQNPEKIRCDACPVMCYIAPGQTGACDRYANGEAAMEALGLFCADYDLFDYCLSVHHSNIFF